MQGLEFGCSAEAEQSQFAIHARFRPAKKTDRVPVPRRTVGAIRTRVP